MIILECLICMSFFISFTSHLPLPASILIYLFVPYLISNTMKFLFNGESGRHTRILMHMNISFKCGFLFQLYDLHVGQVGEQRNAEDGCQREESLCKPADSMLGPRCGNNSSCIGSFHSVVRCVCRPGWRGTHCSIRKLARLFWEATSIDLEIQNRPWIPSWWPFSQWF